MLPGNDDLSPPTVPRLAVGQHDFLRGHTCPLVSQARRRRRGSPDVHSAAAGALAL